jgi:3-phosphoshikimate 1-carboxyvinyltransferase
MASELKKMGVKVEELEEGLVINGREDLSPAVTQSYNDHRIAMSMIIAGFTVDEVTTIENTECVNTSFPGFMDMLEKLVR